MRLSYPETSKRVTAEEWNQRLELAAAYRLAHHFRMSDIIYTHFTAKVPGTEHFLINPFGVMFDEVTASCLVKVDLDGNIIEDPSGLGINPTGFLIHSCIHRARPEIGSVLHTHSSAGLGVAAQKRGLLMLTQHSMRFRGRLAYHDYEGIALDFSEQERLVADLGPHRAMILRNHGLLTAAASVADAFELMYYLERSCDAQLRALAGGAEIIECSDEVAEKVAEVFERPRARNNAWIALRRMIDRIDPSYAD